MKMNLKNQILIAALAGASIFAGNSFAGTSTANMSVTTSIAANCTISASTLAFGSYDPVVANASTNLDNTATITTTCTTGSSPTIALGEGANADTGSTAAAPLRKLISGANVISYSLFSESTRSTVWGSTGVATPTASGTAQTNTVYGRIASGQNKPIGSYSDTVVATVTF